MAQTRESRTVDLPNGNRVTITVGWNRSGEYKTVAVRRPNGTGESKTYRRGAAGAYFLGGVAPYDFSIPDWAAGTGTIAVRAARKPLTRQQKKWIWATVGFIAALVIGIRVYYHFYPDSYGDGRAWALAWKDGPAGTRPFPGCKRNYMVSSGVVQDGQTGIFFKSYGAGEPGDNYKQWRAGCLSAKAVYEQDSQSGG